MVQARKGQEGRGGWALNLKVEYKRSNGSGRKCAMLELKRLSGSNGWHQSTEEVRLNETEHRAKSNHRHGSIARAFYPVDEPPLGCRGVIRPERLISLIRDKSNSVLVKHES